MRLELAPLVLETIRADAARVHPNECCGLLFGTGDRIERAVVTTNVHPNPASHFEIDPQALVDAHRAARAGGPRVIGYYHSHPTGNPEPSATDRAAAARDGSVWAIAADGDVAFWRDGEDGFTALSYTIAGG
jgi:proteasome lid subunit RPN8/RPN11